MGFDLTGYEKDNMQMNSFGLYTLLGIIALIAIILLTAFYMFLEVERAYDQNVTQAEIKESIDYKERQNQFLNSHQIKKSLDKAVEYYNE